VGCTLACIAAGLLACQPSTCSGAEAVSLSPLLSLHLSLLHLLLLHLSLLRLSLMLSQRLRHP
jgi:hypothetical protein